MRDTLAILIAVLIAAILTLVLYRLVGHQPTGL